MKASWRTLKRCVAMLLTFSILLSCTNMGLFTHVHAVEEQGNPSITLGNIIANNYELSEVEKEVLKSGALSAEVTFKYTLPPEEANDDNKLVIVDRENSTITVAEYKDEMGNVWVAKTVTIEVNGDVKETVALTNGNGTYTYNGSAFAVVVEYVLIAGGLLADITEAQQLALMNAVIYLSQDVDYMHRLDKDVALHMEAAGQSVDLTATGFLDMMVIKNDLLGGDSPINLLYSLVEGYNESFTLPSGKQETIVIKLEGDAVAAAESLKAQQDRNGKLDLSYFLEENDCSYLELLYNDSYRAGLETALNQNISDIEGLLAVGGLDDLYLDLVILNSNLQKWEKDAYREINNRYYDIVDVIGPIPGIDDDEVNDIDDLKAVQAAVDAFYADALKDANNKLDEQVNAGNLKEEWLPGNGIQSAADLKTLIDNVRAEYDAGLAEINALLDTYREETGINFPVVKESAHIEYIKDDLNDYIVDNLNTLNKTIEQYNEEYNLNLPEVSYTGLDSLEETAADVQELQSALADAKVYLNNTLNNANAELDRLGYEGADVKNADEIDAIILPWQIEANLEADNIARALTAFPLLFDQFEIDYPGTISSAADVNTAIAWLNNLAGEDEQTANALVAEKKAVRDAILSEINSMMGRYGYTKRVTASSDITGAISYMNSGAEKYIWGRVNEGLMGYITVNSVDDIPGAKENAKFIYESGLYPEFTLDLYNQTIEALDEAVERVEAIPSTKSSLSAKKTELKTAEQELKAAEDALAEVGGEIATLIGFMRTEQAKVVAAENRKAEYDAKIEAAEAVRGQLKPVAPALAAVGEAEELLNGLYDMLAAAPDMIAMLNEAKAMMEAAEDALELLDGYYADMQAADEAKETIANAVDALEKLEYYKGLLDNYLLALPMLIDVFYDFVDYLSPVARRFSRDAWVVKEHVNADADFDMLTAAAEEMIGKKLYTNADLKALDELVITTSKTQFNMSMYTVTVVYKAFVVNPLLVDSDDLYDLIDYKAESVTLEAGASAEQVMAAILGLKAEEAALKSWASYGVNAADFVRTETELPETLEKNFTYVVTYAPKTLNVSYQGMTGPATVLYGHRMSLPACDTEGREYTYTINGTLHYQGEIVTLTENTTIVRREGDASTDRNLLDVVVNATSVSSAVKNILGSSALSYAESIKIRFPSAALLSVDTDEKTLTANKYANAIGEKAWVALSAVTKNPSGEVLENLDAFVNDEAPYNSDFAIADVLYQIAFTAKDANTTDEKILTAMNFANTLVDEYGKQREALDYLSAESFMNALAMLDGSDTTIMGYLEMAKAALATDPAKPALDTIVNDLNNSSNGKLTLYNLLFNYTEQGMAYYYKNDASVRNELAKMQNAMNTLTSSETFMNLVKQNDAFLHDKLLGIKDSLLATSIPAKNGKILTSNDTALKQLVVDLEAYAHAGKTVYTTVGEMKWTTTLSATVGVKIITINVHYGTQIATLKLNFTEGNALDAKDIQDMLSKLAELEAEMGVDKAHYVRDGQLPNIGDVMDPNLTEEDLTYNLTWMAKSYDVIVGGEVVGSVTYEDPYFTLPVHSDPQYRYSYTVDGATYAQGDTVNFKANFDALFASGSLTIERREIDKIREQMMNFVDSMNGAVTLVEHGDRKYSLVLKVDPATISADMSNFAMGMLMSGYGYIGMDGKLFYGAADTGATPQFRLQAMIDMIMNSGMGTQTILDLYGAKGFNNIALDGAVISANGGNIKALGGMLLQSTMSFGSTAEDALEVGFYVTIANSDTVKQLYSAVQSANGLISITLQNGQLDASVNLPDQAYAAYLTALSLVGETNVHSIEEVNAEIALGYLFTLIDPILGNENITTDTFENTLEMFGEPVDLSAYTSAYSKMQDLLNELLADRTYADAGCTINIENFSINALIDWVQKNVVAKLAASFGVSADDIQLSTMIYEYKGADVDESRDDYGLDLKIHAELINLNKNYAALFISPEAAGVANKIGMLTAEEVAAGALANLDGTSVVVLLTDIDGDLVTNGTVLLDLNGKTVNGNIKANGTTYLMDNLASVGGVTGKLSGNITVTDGKYGTDVSTFLPEGYEQKADGTVTNKLFTITADGTDITVTIHTNLSGIRELLNKQSAASMALNIALDLLMNHYNAAALAIGPADGELYQLYAAQFDDIVALLTGDNLLINGANTALSGASLPNLADLFNAVIGDLTDFGAIAEALGNGGVIATYKTEVTAWQLDVKQIEDGDYLTIALASGEDKKNGSLSVVLDGALTEDLKVLFEALDETVKVDSELDLNNAMIDENGLLELIGSYKGAIEVDFTGDRNYVVMLAVILAHGNSSIRSDMIDAIIAYYASGETSLVDLEECFEALSPIDIANALANHSRTTTFERMLKDLGLNGIVDNEIGNDEMGYAKVIDVLGIAIRELKERDLLESILGSNRTLGSFEKTDMKGNYFGFSTNRAFDKGFGPFRGISVGVNLELTQLSIKLRLFAEEALVLVTNAAGDRIGTFDNLEEAFALANKNPGSTITVTGGVVANNNLAVNTDIKLFGIKRITFADGVKILLNSENAKLTTDRMINNHVAVGNADAFCLKIENDGNHTVYTALTHFDSATDNDHVCDYGCGTVVEDCYDNNNDHNCDVCGNVISTCVDEDNDGKCDICGCDMTTACEHVDADNDHKCDICGEVISVCADTDNDHKCDICGEVLSECTDNDNDHYCDICGEVLSECEDADNNHNCDICGEVLSECEDADNDHLCDICGKSLSSCADNDNDHYCDICGDKVTDCVDADNDHKCDICGEVLSDCTDADNDHLCDICREKLSDCTDAPADGDHKCDICGKDDVTECVDSNNDKYCDDCSKVLVPPTIGKPVVTIGNKIFGYQVEFENKILYLDTNSTGVTVAELEALLSGTVLTYDADSKLAIKVVDKDGKTLLNTDRVPNASTITLIASNAAGETTAFYSVVVVGDVNCNGKIENQDSVLISSHYLGKKKLEGLILDAADTNRNGKIENNDAVLIVVKFVRPANYTSRL